MSKWSDAMSAGQSISAAAADEATRAGSPEIDIEHLFLALVVSDGPAGRILRSRGITLDSAREAIAAVHDRELQSLGIAAPAMEPLPKLPLGEVQMDWSHRAHEAFRGVDGELDGSGLLAALLAEPSGAIEQILAELAVDRDALHSDIDRSRTPRVSAEELHEHRGRYLPITVEGFAPAPLEQVWELASDPLRIPVWDTSLQAVTAGEPDQWTGRQELKRLRSGTVKGYQEVEIRVLSAEDNEHRVTYERRWPARRRSGGQRITIELEPTENGTRILVHSSVRRASGVRRIQQLAMTPLIRMMLTAQAAHLATGLSRPFR